MVMQMAFTLAPSTAMAEVVLRPMDTPPPPDPRFKPAPAELCQLAGDWSPSASLPRECDAEEKHDGIRALWIERQAMSREGVPLDCAEHAAAELRELERRCRRRMMIDSEYQEPGGFLDTLAAMSSRGRRGGMGTMFVFDAVPLDQWHADECSEQLWQRRERLMDAFTGWRPQWLRLVNPTPVYGNVEALAATVWARGGEGLMLKDRRSLYRRHRSAAWLKVKRKLELVGRVVEILHGGAAAKVQVEGRTVRVAAANYPLSVGMAVAIEAMEWTDRGQLRQGRIVGTRGDQ